MAFTQWVPPGSLSLEAGTNINATVYRTSILPMCIVSIKTMHAGWHAAVVVGARERHMRAKN